MESSIIYSPLAPDYCDRLLRDEIAREVQDHWHDYGQLVNVLNEARRRFEEDKHDLDRDSSDRIKEIRANHNKLNFEAQKYAQYMARPTWILLPGDPTTQLVHYKDSKR